MLPAPPTVHDLHLRLPSPLEPLRDDRLSSRGIRLFLKRDDLVHPDIPGNKWRKLSLNLVAAREQSHQTLLTFGGAYSNHLLAVAAAGYHLGFRTVGIVRGEQHLPLNEVLNAAAGFGMRLDYLDRETYRGKTDPALLDRLRAQFGDCYILPEGGANALAVQGCTSIPHEIIEPFDVICCAVGTGGTLAGISGGLAANQEALGFAVLKGGAFLNDDVAALQQAAFGRALPNWSIETEFHCGGYAKRSPALNAFIEDFDSRHELRLNWVYEAKMLLGLYLLIEAGRFEPGTIIVAVLAG